MATFQKYKLAALTSHPIQYQAPLFAEIAKRSEIDFTVYFSWNPSLSSHYDEEFGKQIKWDIPLLEGYNYKFLKNISSKSSSKFWGQINFSILKELKQGEYDAIWVHGWNGLTNWLVFIFAPFFGTAIFLRGENPLNQEIGKSRVRTFFKKIILRWLFKRASKILYIGEENRKFYLHYGASEPKLVFCPYALDNKRLIKQGENLLLQKLEIRKSLGINPDVTVFLFVGKLIDKKRPFDLIKAYESVGNASTTLVFVGDGHLRKPLEEYMESKKIPNVFFAGFKNQTELPMYYAIADVLVLPSGLGETWGLVVNEAECFKLSIISSDIVGSSEDLVKENVNGFIFPAGDTYALSRHLEFFADNKITTKAFGDQSFQIVQRYNFQKDIEAIFQAPLVSICIPVRNGGDLIKRALKSCLNQSYKNIEIVVVDNASTDDTVKIVKEFQTHDSRIKLFQNVENIGSLKNFLESFSRASGELVQILCHDDWLSDNYVEEAVKIFNTHPDIGAVFTRTPSYMENENGSFSFILDFSFKNGKHPADYFFSHRYKHLLGANDIISTIRREEVTTALPLIKNIMNHPEYSKLYHDGHTIDQLVVPQILLKRPYFFFTNKSYYVKIGREGSAGRKTAENFDSLKLTDSYRICHEHLYTKELKKYLLNFRAFLGSKIIADKILSSIKNLLSSAKPQIPTTKEIYWFMRDYSFLEKLLSFCLAPMLILRRSLSLVFRKLFTKIKKPNCEPTNALNQS